jgi:hypothetical protein
MGAAARRTGIVCFSVDRSAADGGMMKNIEAFRATQLLRQCGLPLVALLITSVPAHGQRVEITGLVGGMFGGTVKLEEEAEPRFHAHFTERLSFGVSGGVRFSDDDCENCNLIEFRWLRQYSHLSLDQNAFALPTQGTPAFYPPVTSDDFMGDFTHEWPLKEQRFITPFLTASLGAARFSTPETSATRFAFAVSTGVKVFPRRRWGMRFQVEYLGVVMDAQLQRLVCTVGCIVIVNGGVMNQFQISVGPAFRF